MVAGGGEWWRVVAGGGGWWSLLLGANQLKSPNFEGKNLGTRLEIASSR